MTHSTLEHNPPVFTFRFKKDGAFMPDLIAETHAALDAVQNASGEVSLVVTGEEKSFSTGFDLDYASRATEDARQLLMDKAVELLERLLAFQASGDTILNSELSMVSPEFLVPGILLRLDRRIPAVTNFLDSAVKPQNDRLQQTELKVAER